MYSLNLFSNYHSLGLTCRYQIPDWHVERCAFHAFWMVATTTFGLTVVNIELLPMEYALVEWAKGGGLGWVANWFRYGIEPWPLPEVYTPSKRFRFRVWSWEGITYTSPINLWPVSTLMFNSLILSMNP